MQTYIFFGNNHLQAVNFIKYLNQPPKSPIWGTFVLYHVKSPPFGGLGGGYSQQVNPLNPPFGGLLFCTILKAPHLGGWGVDIPDLAYTLK
jgi:hypothetical protein